MRKLIIKNNHCESTILTNNKTLEITSDLNSSTNSLIIDNTISNQSINNILLEGNFNKSHLYINSSCKLKFNNNFLCNKYIKINTNSLVTIVLEGNLTNSQGFIITSSCNLIFSSSLELNNFSIIIDDTTIYNSDIFISGDLSNCNLTVNSPCNLYLDCKLKSLIVNDNVPKVNINLSIDTIIKNSFIDSSITVTGYPSTINEFKSNTLFYENLIDIKDILKILKISNGVGPTSININKKGKYTITAYIILGKDKSKKIGLPIEIEVI
ncbi:hypothetical protein [Clostridium sp. LP20]|uniref:hypothetical protein n=1 Tax=Clostridium sp. LP20 TaxID=3418665 RepID=UPI003EE66D84